MAEQIRRRFLQDTQKIWTQLFVIEKLWPKSTDLDEIKELTKDSWLKKVKQACKIEAFESLLDIQVGYSKGSNLGYGTLKMRGYLKTEEINPSQARLLFKIRTRMLNVKNNYRNGHNELSCPICKDGIDSQEHMMMECEKLGDLLNLQEYGTIFYS